MEFRSVKGCNLTLDKSNYVLLKEGQDSISFCKRLLREARVSTTPGIAFGLTGEGHLRLSFCVDEVMINKAFDRLEAYF